MNVSSHDGVSIAYDFLGDGKPAIVFVHGFCCDRSFWDFQAGYFARHHTVVTVDLAGHGQSGHNRKDWSSEGLGADVVAAVTDLGLEQVILVGHSMGGQVAMEAALQIPKHVMGLVGVDTFRDIEWVRDRKQVAAQIASFRSDFVESMRRFAGDRFLPESDPVVVERVATRMAATRPAVAIALQKMLLETSPTLASRFERVRAPIRCIASERSSVNLEAARRHIRDFRVTYIPKVGHFLMMEDPDTFNRVLDGVITELKLLAIQ